MSRVDDTGGGGATGPFPHYPVSPAMVEIEGGDLVESAAQIKAAGDEAYQQELRARVATRDVLGLLMSVAASSVRGKSRELTESAIVAGGSVNRWAQAITDYNSGVDTLNAEYASARANAFGVPSPSYDTPAAQHDPERVAQQYHDRVAGAEQALLAGLRIRLRALEQTLDDAATSVAGTLDKGPSDDAVLALFEAGALPMGVPALLPGLDFSDIDVRAWLEQLAKYGHLPPGVDPAEVANALAAIDGVLGQDDFGANGNRDDLQRVIDALRGLDPAAADFLLLGLSDDELARLDDMVSDTGDSGWSPFDHNGLDHWDLIDFHAFFLAGTSPEMLRRLQDKLVVDRAGVPQRRRLRGGRGRPAALGDFDMPLFGDDPSHLDVDQGMVGDCWMQAKMAALMLGGGSTWAQDHVRQNANGTITVTMYDENGNPHDVVVTNRLPLDDSGNPAFSGNSGVDSSWSFYYEKAFAIGSEHGSDGERGYGGIEGGQAENDARLMTDNDADELDVNYDDVRSAYEDGRPVVVGTWNDDDIPEDKADAWHEKHEYYVKGFDSDGNLILGNSLGTERAGPDPDPRRVREPVRRRGGAEPVISQASELPDRVTMREGVPTRVTIGAARYRFGINSTDKHAGMVHFTVLREREIEGFRVAATSSRPPDTDGGRNKSTRSEKRACPCVAFRRQSDPGAARTNASGRNGSGRGNAVSLQLRR